MPISKGFAVVLAAIALCAPVACAQASTLPTTGAGVSKHPPVALSQSGPRDRVPSTPSAPGPAPRATPSTALPETGTDPRLLLLMGAALTLIGVGLRLQTADGEHY